MKAAIAFNRDKLCYELCVWPDGYLIRSAEFAKRALRADLKEVLTDFYDVELVSFDYRSGNRNNIVVNKGDLPKLPTLDECIRQNVINIKTALSKLGVK